MAEQKIYFQWQNEALLKTIYPLRTMNLRNALEYFKDKDGPVRSRTVENDKP